MKSKNIICGLAMLAFVPSYAQNPIIHNQFTADPTARVFEGKVYLYPSHDIISPVEPERKWFSMADYHVFSSENLMDWTDHGIILSQENVPWGKPDGYSMWAPDCIYKDGKYYFYYPDAPKSGRGFAVGVATSTSPSGPFIPEKESIKGVMGIDPCVLINKDGSSYIYWSGMGLQGAKLKDNMVELDGTPQRLDENLPAGFKEGPFAFERDGKYYLTYPWVQDKTETLAYAMSDNPMGPFEFKGLIMEQSPTGCWTNHHSLVEYQGQWYLFYHHNDYSPQFDKNRSARIDKVIFNADGTIQPVTPTYRGVGIYPARKRIELDRYSALCPVGASIDFLDPSDTFAGWFVTLDRPSVWVRYADVDFTDESPASVRMRVRSKNGGKVSICVAEDPAFVEVAIPRSKGWTEVKASLSKAVTGLQTLTATLTEGGAVDVDWITFE